MKIELVMYLKSEFWGCICLSFGDVSAYGQVGRFRAWVLALNFTSASGDDHT